MNIYKHLNSDILAKLKSKEVNTEIGIVFDDFTIIKIGRITPLRIIIKVSKMNKTSLFEKLYQVLTNKCVTYTKIVNYHQYIDLWSEESIIDSYYNDYLNPKTNRSHVIKFINKHFPKSFINDLNECTKYR